MPGVLPPLLQLLVEMRRAGLTMDITRCRLVLQALQSGFGSDADSLRVTLHCLLSSSPAARQLVDECYDRFLTEVGSPDAPANLQPAVTEPISKSGGTQPNGARRVEAHDIERAMELLHQEPARVSGEKSPLIVRQLIDAPSSADAAALREASGSPISLRDYLPITGRQLRQTWRYLRVPVREGPPVEFSPRETARRIARTGQFTDPVMVPRRTSRSELTLLIDVHGSMSPFHELARRLVETAEDGGRFRSVRTLYFHNVPDEYLMTSPAFTVGVSLSEFIEQTPGKWASIVIVSDAGAARGGLNRERIRATGDFLAPLRARRHRIVWLNPVPRSRWQRSSAEQIARGVSMLEISRHGLDRAIASLRKSVSRRAPVVT